MCARNWTAVLVALTVASTGWAQDDDDVVALPVPGKPKPAAKPKPAPKPAAPKPAPAKPIIEDDPEIAPLPTGPGSLTLKLAATVPDATWSLDNKDQGPVTTKAVTLEPGEHVVVVKRAGYANFVKKVTVLSGKNVELAVALQATYALVSVSSNVPEAGVYVDGRFMGVTPLKELELNPGTTEISVRKEGYKEDRQTLNLVAGRSYPLSVRFVPGEAKTLTASSDAPKAVGLTPDSTSATLVETPHVSDTPVTSRWYFWAAIGAGVAVAVAVILAVVMDTNNQRISLENQCATAFGYTCDQVLVLPTITRGFAFSFP